MTMLEKIALAIGERDGKHDADSENYVELAKVALMAMKDVTPDVAAVGGYHLPPCTGEDDDPDEAANVFVAMINAILTGGGGQ